MKEKLTIIELKRIMLENFVNEHGNLDISGLDFSDFDGNVNISRIKVKGDLFQFNQDVGGHLFQSNQKVSRNLIQNSQKVIGELIQDCSCEKEMQLPTYPAAEIKNKIRKAISLADNLHQTLKELLQEVEIKDNEKTKPPGIDLRLAVLYDDVIDLRDRISPGGSGETYEEDYLLLDRLSELLEEHLPIRI